MKHNRNSDSYLYSRRGFLALFGVGPLGGLVGLQTLDLYGGLRAEGPDRVAQGADGAAGAGSVREKG